MTDLLIAKLPIFQKIKNVLVNPNKNIEIITNELDNVKDLKESKAVVDSLIREQLLLNLSIKDIPNIKFYLNLSMKVLKKEFCSTTLPFILFSDVFNSLTIQLCEDLFSFMEECVFSIKDTPVFTSGRAMLLRICNDLLRRLSKSQDTVFCGRIQIFLSRLFPLDEKSGLNLMGHFNTDNLTPFNQEEVDITEEISLDLTDNSTDNTTELNLESIEPIKSTKLFYNKFWMLQDMFRNPSQCYDEKVFEEFSSSVDEVLSFFQKFPVIVDRKMLTEEENIIQLENWSDFTIADMTFTKYLTNEKLFDLQLMDLNFRRSIIVQLAVICQYLILPIKFKTADQILDDKKRKWVDEKIIQLQKITDELSNENEPFGKVVKQVLIREEAKSQWKNDGCPSFVRKRPSSLIDDSIQQREAEMSKHRIMVDPKTGERIITFGNNQELNRLWALNPDNLASCKSHERTYESDLYEYFDEARQNLLKAKQAGKIESAELCKDEKWCWSSLRILSRRSQHFYTNWPTPGQKISQYLTTILVDNMDSNDRSNSLNRNNLNSAGKLVSSLDGGLKRASDEEEQTIDAHNDDDEEASTIGDDKLVEDLAEATGPRWKHLGLALMLSQSDIDELFDEKDGITDNKSKNSLLLRLWVEGKCPISPTQYKLFGENLLKYGLEDVAEKLEELLTSMS